LQTTRQTRIDQTLDGDVLCFLGKGAEDAEPCAELPGAARVHVHPSVSEAIADTVGEVAHDERQRLLLGVVVREGERFPKLQQIHCVVDGSELGGTFPELFAVGRTVVYGFDYAPRCLAHQPLCDGVLVAVLPELARYDIGKAVRTDGARAEEVRLGEDRLVRGLRSDLHFETLAFDRKYQRIVGHAVGDDPAQLIERLVGRPHVGRHLECVGWLSRPQHHCEHCPSNEPTALRARKNAIHGPSPPVHS
jgi:hypothetical protein